MKKRGAVAPRFCVILFLGIKVFPAGGDLIDTRPNGKYDGDDSGEIGEGIEAAEEEIGGGHTDQLMSNRLNQRKNNTYDLRHRPSERPG